MIGLKLRKVLLFGAEKARYFVGIFKIFHIFSIAAAVIF